VQKTRVRSRSVRGPKPKGKVAIKWSSDFAYAIGLIATDGNLSSDGRHVLFTSKDREQIENFLCALAINVPIGITVSGYSGLPADRVQFSDVRFYEFLNSIGIFKNKSKTIGKLAIPSQFFFSFLRGCFDGDGTIYSYWDKRWRSSFMFYISFATASPDFMRWLREEIDARLGVSGHVKKDGRGSTYQLTYAKKESLAVIQKMYERHGCICLTRKKLKIEKILAIVGERLNILT